MPRRKSLPDAEVHALVRQLLAEGGEKAVAFGSVSRATGLAGATLVQRFGSRDAMVEAALADGWDRLSALLIEAEGIAPETPKGAATILKALGVVAADLVVLTRDFRSAALRSRAEAWRGHVEAALARRLGGGEKGREAAAILFAAWIGQVIWQPAGGRAFRLKDVMRRLI